MTAVQGRSVQRAEALTRANQIRCARTALLRRMYDLTASRSHQMAADIVEDPPDVLKTLEVGRFLERVRWYDTASHRTVPSSRHIVGRTRMLESARVNWSTPLADLSPQRRAGLAAVLRMRASRVDERTAA